MGTRVSEPVVPTPGAGQAAVTVNDVTLPEGHTGQEGEPPLKVHFAWVRDHLAIWGSLWTSSQNAVLKYIYAGSSLVA